MNITTKKPLVSIIIPTYNGGKLLSETLESALNQSYDRKEIIIVDDGSTINIYPYIKKHIKYIKLIRQQNSGPGPARIRGVLESKGELFSFLDHDDLWSADKIEKQAQYFLDNNECGLVYSYPILIDQNGSIIKNTAPFYFPEGYVFEDFLIKNRITTFSATMIRRTAYDKVGGIDPDPKIITCDDYDLWLRLSEKFKVCFSPGELTFYRIHAGNFVKNYELNMNAHMEVLEKCKKMIISNKTAEKRHQLEKICDRNAFAIFRKYAFIFYYDHHNIKSNLKSRKIFKKALSYRPFDINCLFYYCMTIFPFVFIRRMIRELRRSNLLLV